MEAILTLHQAGNQLGVEDTTLSRLIRVGGLPEARKVNRPEGLVWVIPQEDLPAIARRNGWTIDLRDGAEELLTRDSVDEEPVDRDPMDALSSEGEAAMDVATHPDLEGWDTTRWNQAAGVTSDSALDELADLDEEPTATTDTDTTTGTATGAETDTETAAEGEIADAPAAEMAGDAASPVVKDDGEDSSLEPAPGSDRESAIEVSIAATPVAAEADSNPVTSNRDAVQSMVEALDLALLERLLEAQEGRVSAEVLSQENKHALAALNVTHNRATAELEVERRERMMAADRYREERMARAVADAKVAELRDRLVREMALADTEKAARTEALTRSVKAEREAANAVAAMGWRARRRYRKLSAAMADQIVTNNQQEQSED